MSGQRDNWSLIISGTGNLDTVDQTEAVGLFLWILSCYQADLQVHQARFSSTNYPIAGEIDGLDPNDQSALAAVFAAGQILTAQVKATG